MQEQWQKELHAGHRERMRERFLREGMDSFHAHEVLEMLLYFGIRRGNTNETAHLLLQEFGSLHGVFCADYEELLRIRGIGTQCAYVIRFTGDLMRRTERERVSTISLETFENRFRYFRAQLSGCREEQLLAVCLDDQLRVQQCIASPSGTTVQLQVDAQYLVRKILSSRCSRVMLAHNHPAGRAVPSPEDIAANEQFAWMLRFLSIELVDHIIIAGEDGCSLRQEGVYSPSMLG